MKKSVILFLFLMCISLAYAQPLLNFQKDGFQPGETSLGEIITTGEFAKTISLSDIEFFEGRKKVFFEYDLFFYNGSYFFYAYLTRQGNFTIKISDILYKSPELKSSTIEKQIEVKENFIDENKTQTQILSVRPGFVFSSQTPELILTNKGNSILNFTYNSEEISLSSGDFKKISFIPNKTFSYFNIKTYDNFSVPVIYIPLSSEENHSEFEVKLKPSPSHFQIKILAKQKTEEVLELVNFGEANITDISIETNVPILEFSELEEIESKAVGKVNLSFYSEDTNLFSGDLKISFVEDGEEKEVLVPIEVYVFPENTTESELEVEVDSCAELGGQLCSPDESCNAESSFAYDGYCCLGSCKPKEDEEKSWGWLIGLGILIVLLIVGLLVFKKFKKTKPQKPEEHLKEKSKLYEGRVQGMVGRD